MGEKHYTGERISWSGPGTSVHDYVSARTLLTIILHKKGWPCWNSIAQIAKRRASFCTKAKSFLWVEITSSKRQRVICSELLAMGRDSGQATDAFKLLKMFVKGKGPFEFDRPHHGEACAVGKTEILVSASFKNICFFRL